MAGDATRDHPLGFLIGVWKGEGAGEYPTIAAFRYREEVTFVQPPGKPFLAYNQRTWSLDEEARPMHAEVGYLRCPDGVRVELMLAHPTGHVEVEEGAIEGTTVRLATTSVGRATTAKEVTAIERTIRVDGDDLTYEFRMAAVGAPLAPHLRAELHRE